VTLAELAEAARFAFAIDCKGDLSSADASVLPTCHPAAPAIDAAMRLKEFSLEKAHDVSVQESVGASTQPRSTPEIGVSTLLQGN
jgi:hypothetical protein